MLVPELTQARATADTNDGTVISGPPGVAVKTWRHCLDLP
jgi:hypothetical protein